MPDNQTAPCPACHGSGEQRGFTDGPAGGAYRVFTCRLCRGTGLVSGQHADWRERGAQARKARVQRSEALHQCARRLGVTPAQVTDMETGLADPSPLGV